LRDESQKTGAPRALILRRRRRWRHCDGWPIPARTFSLSRRHARGVIAGAALKGLGGEIQGMLIARDDEEAVRPRRWVTTSHEC